MANQLTDIDLAELIALEAELRFTKFDHADAWWIGSRIVELARQRDLPIATGITRGGQRLFHAALPGSRPDNDEWIDRKVRSTLRFGHCSLYIAVERAREGISLADRSFVDPTLFAAAGGCFPVHIEGSGIIGTITVSGLPQVDDHRLVVEVIREFLAAAAAGTR
jgi:uncharacterized protein (UPF0303 family)